MDSYSFKQRRGCLVAFETYPLIWPHNPECFPANLFRQYPVLADLFDLELRDGTVVDLRRLLLHPRMITLTDDAAVSPPRNRRCIESDTSPTLHETRTSLLAGLGLSGDAVTHVLFIIPGQSSPVAPAAANTVRVALSAATHASEPLAQPAIDPCLSFAVVLYLFIVLHSAQKNFPASHQLDIKKSNLTANAFFFVL